MGDSLKSIECSCISKFVLIQHILSTQVSDTGPMVLWLNFFFSQIWPFGCHDNQSNGDVWTKSICLVENHTTNISKNLLSNICNEIAINVNLQFSYYKSMEI